MARWKPRSTKEVLEGRMTRIDEQIKEHEQAATTLKEERKQLETMIKNMSKG